MPVWPCASNITGTERVWISTRAHCEFLHIAAAQRNANLTVGACARACMCVCGRACWGGEGVSPSLR